MKRISIKILSAFGLLVMLSGCGKDFLNTGLDQNATPETVITNRGAIWDFAKAFYIPMEYGFTAVDNNLFAAATDEAYQTSGKGNSFVIAGGMITPFKNPMESRYEACYEGVRAADFFLEFVKDGKGEALLALNRDLVMDKVQYEKDLRFLAWYRAEANIAKAFYYAELSKKYGDVAIVDGPKSNDGNARFQQSKFQDVTRYIVKLIDENKDKLAPSWSSVGENDQDGRFTLGMALALKARVLLYAASPLYTQNETQDAKDKKWLAAAKAAQEIIDHNVLQYGLNGNYGQYFEGANPIGNKETIFLIKWGTDNNMEKRNYPVATKGGGSGVTPSHNLVSAYEYIGAPVVGDPYANRDPRLAASIVTNGSTWNDRVIDMSEEGLDNMNKTNATKTGYYLKKFLTDKLDLTNGQTAQHHWVVYRYAEVLLNFAEAMNELYGPDGYGSNGNTFTMTARQALKLVRDRASLDLPAVTTTDKDDFRDAIKHERRIEFAFEDHRYWDLRRWMDAFEVLNQDITGVKVSKSAGVYTYTPVLVGKRLFMQKHYLLPFSHDEMQNSKMTLIQNQGY